MRLKLLTWSLSLLMIRKNIVFRNSLFSSVIFFNINFNFSNYRATQCFFTLYGKVCLLCRSCSLQAMNLSYDFWCPYFTISFISYFTVLFSLIHLSPWYVCFMVFIFLLFPTFYFFGQYSQMWEYYATIL